MDLNQAAVFVKVVQAGSFIAAARLLGLPVSTVSYRVAMLEKRLNVTLLQRTTRRLNLTEAGKLYFRHASAGLGHLSDAEAAVMAATGRPGGLLRVTAPADLGDFIIASLMTRMRQMHPEVQLEFVLMDRYADLFSEGIDVAIRAGKLKDSTLIARSIGIARWAAFASPDYLRTAPPLKVPQELQQHCCLQFTALGKEAWTFYQDKKRVSVPMSGQVTVNDVRIVRSLAMAGAGVALLPNYLCREGWGEGTCEKLHRVLPDWHAKVDPLHIVYPRQRYLTPKLRVFIDIAIEEMRLRLDQE